jgi:competence protein ComFC
VVIELQGNWRLGFAVDVHTVSSTHLGVDAYGHDIWDNVRSPMGELVYQLKYRQDRSVIPKIISLLEDSKGIDNFDLIIPIPPTDKTRPFQPVAEIASAIGARYGVPVRTDILSKAAGGPQLKNVSDPAARRELLGASLAVSNSVALRGKKVLLVDDLFRSGATLEVATEVLSKAGAGEVFVLTMTKTRSHR